MTQRSSGYKPKHRDRYFTQPEATAALLSAYDFARAEPIEEPAIIQAPGVSSRAKRGRRPAPYKVHAWNEPCAGAGHICGALERLGCGPIFASDIAPLRRPKVWGGDILKADAASTALPLLPLERKRVVTVTNLPYGYQFRTALALLPRLIDQCAPTGAVAALFPIGFDTRESRQHLFRPHAAFAGSVILTFRLRWANLPQKKNGPSTNHQWLIWDWVRAGQWPPFKLYRDEADAVAMLNGARASQAGQRPVEARGKEKEAA